MGKASEISAKIKASLDEIKELNEQLETLAAQKAYELLNARVFTGDAKDVNNKSLSPYSKAYAKKRKDNGRQTSKKDLIFTGALFESVQVGLANNKTAVGFLTEAESKIGGYQEDQNDTKIFALSDDERNEVQETVKEFVIEELKKIVLKWS